MNDPTDQDYPALSYGARVKRTSDGTFKFEADEFHSEVAEALSIATKAATTIYTVPTGKKLHLRNVMVAQKSIAHCNVYKFSDASGVAFAVGVGSGVAYVPTTGLKGITLTGAVTVTKTTAATGVVTIGGILDPQDNGYI